MVFVDYSKAFDTLQHNILIKKLDDTGIRGPLLKWFENYVTDRAYVVQVDGEISERVAVTEGTAQGSVLGPLHYLAYVNDLKNLIKKCKLFQYADDTCIIAANRNLNTALEDLQQDFDSLCRWSHDVGLVLNSQKTKLLHIRSSHNKCFDQPYLISHNHDCLHFKSPICNCTAIDEVTQHTYLGLVLDSRFNWDRHIETVCNKLRAIMAKLYLGKSKLTFKTALLLYTSLMDSIVSYGLSAYGRTFKSYLYKIHNIQKRTLKMILPPKVLEKFRQNDEAVFKFCKVLPINKKVTHALITQNYFECQQNYVKHKITTRAITRQKLVTNSAKNFYGKRTTNYLLPRYINDLPTDLKSQLTKNNIKYKIKNYLLNTEADQPVCRRLA